MKKSFVFFMMTLLGCFLLASCCKCDKNNQCKCDNCCQCKCADADSADEPCEFGKHPRPDFRGDEFPDKCPFKEEANPEMKAKWEKWMKFDSLSKEEQIAILKEKKAEIDKREAEIAAKKAEMEQRWANFDNLSIEEQKQLIDMKMPHKMFPPKFGKECKKEFRKGKREHGHREHRGEKPSFRD